MTETTFKAPGFFDREIDLTVETQSPSGIPAGIVGTATKGPAFVPVTVGSTADFITKFGELDTKMPAPYAAHLFLKNRHALTFVRTLGAGANETSADIDDTRTKGIVTSAGFKIENPVSSSRNHAVQFLTARHKVSGDEFYGLPMFTDNSSFFTTGSSDAVNLVRGVLFTADGTNISILHASQSYGTPTSDVVGRGIGVDFKLAISSSAGVSFGSTDGNIGVRIVSCSLNPSSDNYFAKVLNTDPTKFGSEKHLVYLDFAVDAEVADLNYDTIAIGLASGSLNTSSTSGDALMPFRNAFGHFDTRFTTPSTPKFISQPFGLTEYNLFAIEPLDDGAYANNKIKISISNLRASTDPKNPYGTFSVLVRNLMDDDTNPEVLEQFVNCTLNPDSEDYIARQIGDMKSYFNFDVENVEDRRIVKNGTYPSRSNYIRVVMDQGVVKKTVPAKCLPFGFRGVSTLNTNPTMTDAVPSDASSIRLAGLGAVTPEQNRLFNAIVPPLPYRFKVTRGTISTVPGRLAGAPGSTEIADSRYFWGLKTTRNTNPLNPNVNGEFNKLILAYTAFVGIDKLDTLVTGSNVDNFNDNKFTLAKVALGNSSTAHLTSSVDTHMKEAAYIRNAVPSPSDYTIEDSGVDRITFATILQSGNATLFNRFADFAKFTTLVYGGFDGLNILDKEQVYMTDKATSAETNGGANAATVSPGFATNISGVTRKNNCVASYRAAAKLITDPFVSNVNIIAVPGQREPLVTDFMAECARDYKLAQYIMDVPAYDSNSVRVFDGSNTRISVSRTADMLEGRALDNEFIAAYFPNISIEDTSNNNRRVIVPASAAAVSAFGFNDRVAYPWFAAAGLNRGALDFVKAVQVKISQPERERLFSVRLNPIIKLPNEGFVIFSQKTMEQAGTALKNVNINRMVMSVKQQIIDVGNSIIFDQITPSLRSRFVDLVKPILSTVQIRDGIERYEIICNDRNNTQQDVLANRMNAQIRIVPVYATEFINLDFIITNSGIQFAE